MEIPNNIKKYMELIIDNGYECFLVGGAVRDYLLNKSNKDYDFCTNIPFDKLKALIPKIAIMRENNHRNTSIVRIDEYDLEFSEYRGDSLKEDLSNRDFTMNAVAVDVNGKLIDYFNGVEDIKNKTVSLIKPSGEAFEIDALRILRAIRQALKLGFKIDENTKANMLGKKHLLQGVAKERVLDELKKILVSDNVEYYLSEYKEIFFEIIPELRKCDGFNQYNDYHVYDVYNHTIQAVKNSPKNEYLRLAALFHDIGKPDRFYLDGNNIGHFLNHATTSCEIFNSFADIYKADNKTKKIVSALILYHEDVLSSKNNKIYNFYKKYDMDDIELLFELKIADAKAQNPKYGDRINELKELEIKYINVRERYKKITYNGDDLIELGYSGKIIGTILDDIKRQVVNNVISNDKQSIDKYVQKKTT